ncbi:unnamed protein product [Spirodela intermedia]|uniref:Uncharacterized protein n=1 Tax=Spirodela intermedia TaxID=51605 RepID=A0A7I8IHI5_SPIIN|nr:unnamed protein product [Spirodela intermedia]CAA6657184.1 unnamed protein product [Spirodela intermedia]CAA6674126.1 unnamed protein product [Spirodela intermedia]
MISILVWNCRRIDNMPNQCKLIKLINKHRIGIIALLESMVPTTKAENIRGSLGLDNVWCYPIAKIWLFWADHLLRHVCATPLLCH